MIMRIESRSSFFSPRTIIYSDISQFSLLFLPTTLSDCCYGIMGRGKQFRQSNYFRHRHDDYLYNVDLLHIFAAFLVVTTTAYQIVTEPALFCQSITKLLNPLNWEF